MVILSNNLISEVDHKCLVFKSLVWSGFWPFLDATATGLILWYNPKNRTETEKNQLQLVLISFGTG